MTDMTLMPRGQDWTADDLQLIPDDGHRYELIDGTLIVTPGPRWGHQRISARLHRLLMDACPAGMEVLAAPFEVRLAVDTAIQPDLLMAPIELFTDTHLPVAPTLAVEILSPSTRSVDLLLKRARLERAGCPHYWIVDPVGPRLIAWELRDQEYVEVADVSGNDVFVATEPCAVSFVPSSLVG